MPMETGSTGCNRVLLPFSIIRELVGNMVHASTSKLTKTHFARIVKQ